MSLSPMIMMLLGSALAAPLMRLFAAVLLFLARLCGFTCAVYDTAAPGSRKEARALVRWLAGRNRGVWLGVQSPQGEMPTVADGPFVSWRPLAAGWVTNTTTAGTATAPAQRETRVAAIHWGLLLAAGAALEEEAPGAASVKSWLTCRTPWPGPAVQTPPMRADPVVATTALLSAARAIVARRGGATLLCGPPGTGKSTMATLVARELQKQPEVRVVNIVLDYDLARAGLTVTGLFEQFTPSESEPLVVCIDEVGKSMAAMVNDDPPSDREPKWPRQWCNRADVLSFLDVAEKTLHVYWIFTSNETLAWWTSQWVLARPGRFSEIRELLPARGEAEVRALFDAACDAYGCAGEYAGTLPEELTMCVLVAACRAAGGGRRAAVAAHLLGGGITPCSSTGSVSE